MNGFEYVRKTNHLSLEDIAKEFGVSRQFVAMWEKGHKKIPKVRLEQLSKKFEIPKNYFQKELTEIDKLNIEIINANNEINKSSFIYEDEIYDSTTGSTITVEREHVEASQIEYLDSLKVDKKEALTIERFKKSLENTSKYGFNIDEMTCLREYTQCVEDNIELFNRFISIVNCVNIDNYLLHQIMRATELLDERLSDKNIIWGEENPMDISSVSDESTIVQELFIVLNKYVTQEKMEQEEIKKMAEETSQKFKDTDNPYEIE